MKIFQNEGLHFPLGLVSQTLSQNAPTLINGLRSRKKVRLISSVALFAATYSGKHFTNTLGEKKWELSNAK